MTPLIVEGTANERWQRAAKRGVRYGRRPPKNAPALKLANYLTGVVPTHPDRVDYLAAMNGGWKMLGNDTYGDCVAVCWANDRRLVSKTIGSGEVYPTQAQVYDIYKTQNPSFPSEDNGMDMQTLYEYLVKTGGPDGVKALGFAKVDYTNAAELDAAIAIFGNVQWGVTVLDANMDDFDNGMPWDYHSGSVDGGHCVLGGGYQPAATSSGALAGVADFVTWAEETSFTQAFINKEAEECWIIIWPEHVGTKAFQEGIDVATLAADYQAITGKPFPVPVPAPTPEPTPPPTPPTPAPVPTPVDADAALAAAQETWEAKLSKIAPLPRNVALRDANQAWRAAKGL